MSVNIFYNGVDFFSQNNLVTPNVSRGYENIMFGDIVGKKENVVLSGTIHVNTPPSNCDYMSELNTLRNNLISFFSEDFKPIEIRENGVSIYERDFCKITSISFPESNYVKTLEYSINIECYDESLHNEFFGVKDPSNSTSITLGEDGIYQIRRSISASGVNLQDGNLNYKNTSEVSSGLENAIDFVKSFSGKENVPLPSSDPNIKIYLKSTSESINRLLGTYSIEEFYIADQKNTNIDQGILRYSIGDEKSFGEVRTVVISGELMFGKESNFDTVRDRFNSINFREEAEQRLSINNLIKEPISVTINEDESKKLINFSYQFDDDENFDNCGVSKTLTYSIKNYGEEVNISVSGVIEARGKAKNRWDRVLNAYNNSSYNVSLYSSWINESAQAEINKYYPGITLYKYPELKSVTQNERGGSIKFEYAYTNREKIENFKNLSISTNVSLPSPTYSVDKNFGGGMDKHIVSRSGFRKGKISVSIDGIYDSFTGNESVDRAAAISFIEAKVDQRFNEIASGLFSGYLSVTSSMNKSYSKNSNKASVSESRDYFEQ